ncbi:hypothetical protein CVV38_02905 [Candidatus Peregrinibacteria bacterium HGW-Peregrinibacteria-1]|jgi:hypothetical protein|nr:MAG: hypothetical protein CVV38_02905 [Candidatus Peregrinibacteria bacterium HGW-Peregrinibacteria-1]
MAVLGSKQDIDLTEILEEMFLVLTGKEKDVIIQRFSLDSKPKRTLESIGRSFSVTRERIRQIEKIALNKLKRTASASKINDLNGIANELIDEFGGIATDKKMVSGILNRIKSEDDIDGNIVRLALNINPALVKTDKSSHFYTFWKKKDIDSKLVNAIINNGVKILKKKGDVIKNVKLAYLIRQELTVRVENFRDEMFVNALEVDRRVKIIEEGVGLVSWRHINPKSIRDKAYIVLKNSKEPLHFVEIANRITNSGFDSKVVTTQAVHNELIRYEQFVLVGRGLYALKEQGYVAGTVAEVIEALLKKNGEMTKREIIEGVLKQRKVKKGTISLNLQKNECFVRVGRAVYKLEGGLQA